MTHYISIKNHETEEFHIVGPMSKTEMVDVVASCYPQESYSVDDVKVMSYDEWMAEVDTRPRLVIKKSRLAFDVEINMSGNDWQLYTTKEDWTESVARSLNCALKEELQLGATSWLELYRKCDNVMANYRHWGACDTEPRRALRNLLEELGMPEGIV